MSVKRKFWICFYILAVSCLTPSLSAVIVVVREYHGKQVNCLYSGLIGVAKSCGTEGYARVFTGIVRSSVEKGDTDKILELVPDESLLVTTATQPLLSIKPASALTFKLETSGFFI